MPGTASQLLSVGLEVAAFRREDLSTDIREALTIAADIDLTQADELAHTNGFAVDMFGHPGNKIAAIQIPKATYRLNPFENSCVWSDPATAGSTNVHRLPTYWSIQPGVGVPTMSEHSNPLVPVGTACKKS